MSEQLGRAHRELAAKVMGRKGVSGTAIGREGGEACLKVYVTDAAAERGLPRKVGGFKVVVERTGSFKPL